MNNNIYLHKHGKFVLPNCRS